MKLAVVTDSTVYLSEKVQKRDNLFIVPIPIILDGKVYNEGVDIEIDGFYDLLKKNKEFPTTSQPALGEVITLYESIAKQGYDTIISIHLSSGISGFVQTLEGIKESIEGVKIVPYDSKITSLPMGHIVETALEMADAGVSLEKILEKLDYLRDNIYAYLIVDDLQNLVRGGRLTNGAAIIGGLLKIKPILTFEEGKIVLLEKIRSTKKALKRAEQILDQRIKEIDGPVEIYVIHCNSLETAEEEQQRLKKKYPGVLIRVGEFGPVIGTHLGEKAIALAVTPQ